MGGREKYGFPVLDCDGHVTEPLVIWDKYLEAGYREQAREHFSIQNTPEGVIWVVEEYEGPRAVDKYGGPRRLHPGRYVRTGAYRPGTSVEQIGKVDTHGMMWGPEYGYMNPGGFDSRARIRDMDVEGIDKAVIIPSFFAMLPGVHDPKLAAALCRAYNDWAYDYCSAYPDRLFPSAMVPVQDLELAVKEFERVAKKGFRIAAARPSAMAGYPIHHTYFFPLWERLQEAGVGVLFHPFPTTDLEGGGRFLQGIGLTYLSEALAFTLDNMVSLTGLMTQGVLDKFPNLRLGLIESSCTWVAGVLDRLDKRLYLQKDMFPGMKTLPSDIFRRQVFISFEAAEQAAPLVAPLFQDNLIWASDYPHLDSDPPAMAVEKMNTAGLPKQIQAKVMGSNAARLFGIPLNGKRRV